MMPGDAVTSIAKRDSTFQEWIEGVNALAAASTPEALSSLLPVLYERGQEGKEKVISIFRDKPDTLIYPVLEHALRDNENAGPRNAAMEVCVALGARSLPFLLSILRDADEEIRTFAGVMLGELKETEAVPDLIQALADSDPNVKHAAAEALGKIKDVRAVEPLIEALNADMWLQFPAAIALGDLGDTRAVPPLITLLETPGANMPAIQALGKIGDPSALGQLSKCLQDGEPSLREWALEAMKEIFIKNPNTNLAISLSGDAAEILLRTMNSRA